MASPVNEKVPDAPVVNDLPAAPLRLIVTPLNAAPPLSTMLPEIEYVAGGGGSGAAPVKSRLGTSAPLRAMFSVPGIGREYIRGIVGNDYPLIMATTLLYAFFIVIANLSVDLVYGMLDPRIKVGK